MPDHEPQYRGRRGDLEGRRDAGTGSKNPALAPGRVQVAIVPTRPPAAGQPGRTVLDVLDEIRAGHRPRGWGGRWIEEMETKEAGQQAKEAGAEALANHLEPDRTPPPGAIFERATSVLEPSTGSGSETV